MGKVRQSVTVRPVGSTGTQVHCTTLDHIYPSPRRFGQKCYCGQQIWGSKKKTDATAESACVPVADVAQSETSTTVSASADGAAQENTNMLLTFTRRGEQKNGMVSYSLEGLRGSIYVNKSLFAGDLPQTIDIGAEGLATPGAAKVTSAEKLTKMQEAATKAADRAKKATDRAEKAAAKLAKLTAPVGSEVPTVATEATAGEI
jgi:hypothetical protein